MSKATYEVVDQASVRRIFRACCTNSAFLNIFDVAIFLSRSSINDLGSDRSIVRLNGSCRLRVAGDGHVQGIGKSDKKTNVKESVLQLGVELKQI
jgi:hypothetical protein